MGIFDSIGNAVKNVVSAITPTKAKLENVGAVLNAAFNPFSKDKVVANTPSPTLNKVLETAANHPYISAGITAVVAAPSAALAAAKAAIPVLTSAAKSLVPKSAIGKVAAVAAAPIAASAFVNNPFKVLSAVPSYVNFASNAGNLLVNPSLDNLKTTFSENPITSSVIGAGLTLAAGVGLTKTAVSIANLTATEANTKAIENSGKQYFTNDGGMLPSGASALSTAPALPQTSVVSTSNNPSGSSKRHTRKKKVAEPTRISQKVNVVVQNRQYNVKRSQTVKYLNTLTH